MRGVGICRRTAAAAALWGLQSSRLVSHGVSGGAPSSTLAKGFACRIGGEMGGFGIVGRSRCENLSRSFATAHKSQLRGELLGEDHPTGLLHVLRCEIDDLRTQAEAIASRSPPKPFKLVKDEPGELEITLERTYGLEDITVGCILQLVPKDYQRDPVQGEDPDMRKKMLQLTISIRKGAEYPVLKLLCEGYRDGFAVHQVDLKSDAPGETVYRPYFSEETAGLVDEVQIFLYERGLTGDLTNYLQNALEYKRLRKSTALLGKIESFIR
ncbi:complement component 1 Q subcomponent-binding protein, mitochondrial [Marchantia polymorpha subsp. ruderalis]|uniref:Uncharacterized protein n=3 Tax=Marchantia polymorpha TaxID=3197 RepID=A0AAF6BY37_MARPO|nr:hypothetical protein MARPO_0003s0064 [Marchantia polymorpha]BBN16921.1 hypothetical protein Mp_7g10450 [Marchantia polymorpha subsp. ruderalis]|eukprot:PTQ49162.1 hypothetical protein MARPO_0003s0064 [Marchantia polymorpha]